MNMKKSRSGFHKKLASLMTALLMVLAMVATTVPALAANTPVNGGTTTFDKYLTMSTDANVPNVTFNFSVSAGEATGSILPGIQPQDVVVGSAVFAPTDSTTNGLPTDADGATEGQKYATKEVTVDFSKVSFPDPGVYRYIITETPSTASGITNDTNSTRTLDVYVGYRDGSDTDLVIIGYALGNDEEKSDGFTNTYGTNNLTLTKEVTGNQGDRNKSFAFTVEITGAVAGTQYTVTSGEGSNITIQDGIGAYDSVTGKLTATNGSVKFTCQLKHGDSIVIKGLTGDTKYTITETDYSSEGYETSYKVDSGEPQTANTTGELTMGAQSHTVTFTNAKNGTVPTGILLDVAPYLILCGVVIVCFVALFVFRRRRAR